MLVLSIIIILSSISWSICKADAFALNGLAYRLIIASQNLNLHNLLFRRRIKININPSNSICKFVFPKKAETVLDPRNEHPPSKYHIPNPNYPGRPYNGSLDIGPSTPFATARIPGIDIQSAVSIDV
jgi:hypothetical protein